MRRLTVSVHGEVMDELRAIARRRGLSLAQITREALAAYVSREPGRRTPLSLAGIGRSGRTDVAEQDEELLMKGFRYSRLTTSAALLHASRVTGGNADG